MLVASVGVRALALATPVARIATNPIVAVATVTTAAVTAIATLVIRLLVVLPLPPLACSTAGVMPQYGFR